MVKILHVLSETTIICCCFFIKAIEQDGTQQNCDVVGTHFLSEMLKLRDEFEVVGDVRGKGLMLGFELVADKVSAVDTEYELIRSATYPPPCSALN